MLRSLVVYKQKTAYEMLRSLVGSKQKTAYEMLRSLVGSEMCIRDRPFIVVRFWLGGHVHGDRPAFLGTSGYGPLDNVSVLERFEEGAVTWSRAHRGSVVELHAYACQPEVATDPDAAAAVAVSY